MASPERSSTSDPRPPKRSNKFRFKGTKRAAPTDPDLHYEDSSSRHSSHRSKRHKPSSGHRHRHHHSHRHHSNPSYHREDSRYASPMPTIPPLSPNTAFRESLFDALADDEGAAYWEGVYGQPLHTYSRYYVPQKGDSSDGEDSDAGHMKAEVDEDGKPILERMDDEEYAAYVRRRMWEKSHEGILEERERRAKKRRERELWEAELREVEKLEREWERKWERERERERERRKLMAELNALDEKETRERSKRRKEKHKSAWERYLKGWEELKQAKQRIERREKGVSEGRKGEKNTDDGVAIPWPVRSGKQNDVTKNSVEEFFRTNSGAVTDPKELIALLKIERVRWHPDKMAQHYRSLGIIGEKELRMVTAVFQIVDQMWSQLRGD